MAFDAFLKIEGIPGESRDLKHKDEIEVLSFSWGVTQPQQATQARLRPGRADVQDFSIVKLLDKASPLLFVAACPGDHSQEAVLTARKRAKRPLAFYKISMS